MTETIIILVGVFLIVLALRELACWYFKINSIVKLLSEIRDLLKNGTT